jgi:Ni2+-binding GTPase involved in maturation of urease and hydrogenase
MKNHFQIHQKEQTELLNVLRRTIYHGENNSTLIIGPRGSGKTFMVNDTITTIRNEMKTKNCSDDLIIVYLSGMSINI